MLCINWEDLVDILSEMEGRQEKSFSIEGLKEYYDGDDIYNRIPLTKYHIGDKFVHSGGMTAIITEINEYGEYHLEFTETATKRTIGVPFKNAWYNDKELDNFIEYVDRKWSNET